MWHKPFRWSQDTHSLNWVYKKGLAYMARCTHCNILVVMITFQGVSDSFISNDQVRAYSVKVTN